MTRSDTRQRLLDAGLRLMFRTGYRGSGVRDVVAAAGAPQGSFTNHFRSKEEFAGEVLGVYADHTHRLVQEALGNTDLGPRDRLLRYLEIITDRLSGDGYARGCLIGDFSLEVSHESEALRARLNEVYARWLEPFERCIAEAQELGEIDRAFTPSDLSEFLICGWEGAILRMKVQRDPAALQRFKTIAFATVFRKDNAR